MILDGRRVETRNQTSTELGFGVKYIEKGWLVVATGVYDGGEAVGDGCGCAGAGGYEGGCRA